MSKKLKKFDKGKNMLQLIDPMWIEDLGKVLTMGALKYGIENWKNIDNESRPKVIGAILRHIIAYLKGDVVDKESGLPHLAHAQCNMMFLNWYDNKVKKCKI